MPNYNTNSKTIQLLQKCEDVLNNNWRENFTVPSANLYPFQWLWDSGFVAMGWSLMDKAKARLEIKTLLDAQWANGLIPHIVFHNDSPDKHYFPGAEFHFSKASKLSPKHINTTGLTQPPVLGFVLEYLFQNEDNKNLHRDFYENALKTTLKFHEYLYENRDPYNEGLVYIRHNWESGTDNSAAWDKVWAKYTPPNYDIVRKDTTHVDASERPTKKDYNYYLHLIELSKNCGYDEKKNVRNPAFFGSRPSF